MGLRPALLLGRVPPTRRPRRTCRLGDLACLSRSSVGGAKVDPPWRHRPPHGVAWAKPGDTLFPQLVVNRKITLERKPAMTPLRRGEASARSRMTPSK